MDDFNGFYSKYVDMVYKICFIYLKRAYDAEEAVQETFIKYLRYTPVLSCDDHEKAWLIKTASNICKNILRSNWWKRIIPCDDLSYIKDKEERGVLEEVLALPIKYKMPIYLFYYEGYKVEEISSMLLVNVSTVKSHLHRGRKLLKVSIEGGERI